MSTNSNKRPKIVPMSEAEEDPNAKWAHALPLEQVRLVEDRRAELEFMKDLFFERLPIGKDTGALEATFNRINEAICNQETINHDEFPSYDEVDVDGAVQDPPKEFHYFSASVLEQQARRGQLEPHGPPLETDHEPLTQSQDMASPSDGQTCDSASGDVEEHGDMEPDAFSTNWNPLDHSDGDD